MKQPVERKLAAILAGDLAGYSRLMGADEEGTHEPVKAHIGQHRFGLSGISVTHQTLPRD
jgi:hypothetical protein